MNLVGNCYWLNDCFVFLDLCLIYHFPYLFSFLFSFSLCHLNQNKKTRGALLSVRQSHFYHRGMYQELLVFWRKPQSTRMWWHVMIVDLWWFKELDVGRIREEDWNCFLKGWNLRKNQRTWVGNQMGVLLNCLNHNQWICVICFCWWIWFWMTTFHLEFTHWLMWFTLNLLHYLFINLCLLWFDLFRVMCCTKQHWYLICTVFFLAIWLKWVMTVLFHISIFVEITLFKRGDGLWEKWNVVHELNGVGIFQENRLLHWRFRSNIIIRSIEG